jgi:CHAD domain-containing protein
MAEQLREGESALKSVRRIVRREATKALERVDVDAPPPDAAIHDARKRLKRARAALRLVRKPLGAHRFRRENEAFRDAARPLSEIRDSKILVEAFDALIENATSDDRRGLKRVRDVLIAHQLQVRGRVFRKKAPLKPVIIALRSVRRRTDDWSLGGSGWAALGHGVRRVYRSGREVFTVARQKPRDGTLHELRKQAKYLSEQLEILAPIAPRMLKGLADRAHKLSDALGDDHDLGVLRQRLRHLPARVPRVANATLSRMIEAKRRQLQAKAFALGARVYDETPRRFVKRLQDRWHVWRAQ